MSQCKEMKTARGMAKRKDREEHNNVTQTSVGMDYFISSQFEGFVEMLDTFIGSVQAESLSAIDTAALTAAVDQTLADMTQATDALEMARQALVSAPIEEIAVRKAAAQKSVIDRHEASVVHFDALFEQFFGSKYRPAPPVVEISELLQQRDRCGLLFEAPEPLDWSRLAVRLSRFNNATNS
jgi:hypothetical protein